MEKSDIEILREQVSCAAVLARAGWSIDQKESTRRAVKYRRGDGEIICVASLLRTSDVGVTGVSALPSNTA